VSPEIGVERPQPGSIDLSLTMPTVGDLLGAAPVWQQPRMFLSQPRPEQSPLDVFGEALRDAVEERDDALTLDAPLLEPIASARALFDLGAEQSDGRGRAMGAVARHNPGEAARRVGVHLAPAGEP